MLIGAIVGIAIASALIEAAASRQLQAFFGSPWVLLAVAVVVPVLVGKLLSGVLPRIVGSAAFFVAVGVLVSAVIAAFTGQLAYTWPLLLLLAACGGLQKWCQRVLMVQAGYASSLEEAEQLAP